ncbi:MAG TPA: methyltransferase [Flavipsychrobacter sp.]|nr:methyltransferase [Flavipsychrobacter sp.]
MSNSYFQFKQFRVDQEHCAMKVSTDACIQGAWTPVSSEIKNILDIGAGTGLLSLMMAQRNKTAHIDAIELDTNSARQAQQNFEQSEWGKRLNIIEADVRQYKFEKKYDLVICNPPFFVNSLLGNNEKRNVAKHTINLLFKDLFHAIVQSLSPTGYASVLLPAMEHKEWSKLLEANNWQIFHELNIVPRVKEKPNRVISLCSSSPTNMELTEDLIIRNSTNEYTPEFTHLLKPFYLKL